MSEQGELLPEEEESEEYTIEGEGLAGRRLRVIRDVDDKYVFRFEFGPAILAQVMEKLDSLPTLPLREAINSNPKYPGFYQLFWNADSVYVGRTIRPIGVRLREHHQRLRGRVPLHEISVKFVFVEDLSLVALSEATMINYFQPLGLDRWGTLGFGSKAPGHGRARQTSKWDAEYRPNLELQLAVDSKPMTLGKLITAIARESPIRLSIPKTMKQRFAMDHPAMVHLPKNVATFSEWMEFIAAHLAPGWRVQREAMTWYIEAE